MIDNFVLSPLADVAFVVSEGAVHKTRFNFQMVKKNSLPNFLIPTDHSNEVLTKDMNYFTG